MSLSPQNAFPSGYGEMPFPNQLQDAAHEFIACLDLCFDNDAHYTQDSNFSELQNAVLGRSNGVNGMNLESLAKASFQLRIALADAYREQILQSTKPNCNSF